MIFRHMYILFLVSFFPIQIKCSSSEHKDIEKYFGKSNFRPNDYDELMCFLLSMSNLLTYFIRFNDILTIHGESRLIDLVSDFDLHKETTDKIYKDVQKIIESNLIFTPKKDELITSRFFESLNIYFQSFFILPDQSMQEVIVNSLKKMCLFTIENFKVLLDLDILEQKLLDKFKSLLSKIFSSFQTIKHIDLMNIPENRDINKDGKCKKESEFSVKSECPAAEFEKRRQETDILAHQLIGCCQDGKCGSLDGKKSQDKKDRKNKRKKEKRRNKKGDQKEEEDNEKEFQGVISGLLNEKSAKAFNEKGSKKQLPNILLKNSVEEVSNIVQILYKISELEEKLIEGVTKIKSSFEILIQEKSRRYDFLIKKRIDELIKNEQITGYLKTNSFSKQTWNKNYLLLKKCTLFKDNFNEKVIQLKNYCVHCKCSKCKSKQCETKNSIYSLN